MTNVTKAYGAKIDTITVKAGYSEGDVAIVTDLKSAFANRSKGGVKILADMVRGVEQLLQHRNTTSIRAFLQLTEKYSATDLQTILKNVLKTARGDVSLKGWLTLAKNKEDAMNWTIKIGKEFGSGAWAIPGNGEAWGFVKECVERGISVDDKRFQKELSSFVKADTPDKTEEEIIANTAKYLVARHEKDGLNSAQIMRALNIAMEKVKADEALTKSQGGTSEERRAAIGGNVKVIDEEAA